MRNKKVIIRAVIEATLDDECSEINYQKILETSVGKLDDSVKVYLTEEQISLSENQINIPVGEIVYFENGNTIWVHGPHGGTTLRIKCSGSIKTDQCKDSPVSHCDIMVVGDITFCCSKDAVLQKIN